MTMLQDSIMLYAILGGTIIVIYMALGIRMMLGVAAVSYTHLRAHET